MADDVMDTVQARIHAEQARMTDLERRIADLRDAYDRAKAEVGRMLAFAEVYSELTGKPQTVSAQEIDSVIEPLRRPKNPPRELVVANVLDIIHDLNRPASRKELFDALASRGILIEGKDPEMVLSTMLWRSQDRVVRLPSHGYWPTRLQYEEADYYPLSDGDVFDAAAKEPEDGIEADDAE